MFMYLVTLQLVLYSNRSGMNIPLLGICVLSKRLQNKYKIIFLNIHEMPSDCLLHVELVHML